MGGRVELDHDGRGPEVDVLLGVPLARPQDDGIRPLFAGEVALREGRALVGRVRLLGEHGHIASQPSSRSVFAASPAATPPPTMMMCPMTAPLLRAGCGDNPSGTGLERPARSANPPPAAVGLSPTIEPSSLSSRSLLLDMICS